MGTASTLVLGEIVCLPCYAWGFSASAGRVLVGDVPSPVRRYEYRRTTSPGVRMATSSPAAGEVSRDPDDQLEIRWWPGVSSVLVRGASSKVRAAVTPSGIV